MSKKEAYLHAITADMTERCSTVVNDVRRYCNEWKSGGKTALGGYSMPKHHAVCDMLIEDRPWFAGPPGLTSHRCFQEASLQNHK